MHFPVADIEFPPLILPLVACTISFFTSMAGVSGGFLLLPFQVSILGFSSPAVSSTNHLFNIIAIPSGIYRFLKEGRMLWPLTWVIVLGTLPGVVAGALIRVTLLASPEAFKIFVGLVLLYLGIKLCLDIFKNNAPHRTQQTAAKGDSSQFIISQTRLTMRRLEYTFNGVNYSINTASVFLLSLAVGTIGGIYGVGGGALISPILVTLYRLPIHTVAGAGLMGAFVTSAFGVLFFHLLALSPLATAQQITPDYKLGLLFGIGGAIGIYLGARAQRYVPEKIIKSILTFALFYTAAHYIIG